VEELERIRQTKRRLAEELSSAEGNPQEIMRINAEMGDLNQSASEIMTKISEVKRFQDIMFNLMKSLYDIRQRGFDNIVQNIGRIGG
jgi:hypothetical protein